MPEGPGRALLESTAVANPDHTLAQVGPVCLDTFSGNIVKHYAADAPCANYIMILMAAANDKQCPDKATVKACLNKNEVGGGHAGRGAACMPHGECIAAHAARLFSPAAPCSQQACSIAALLNALCSVVTGRSPSPYVRAAYLSL